MLYRIFTENKNLEAVEKIVNKYFEGYTIIKAEGYWRLVKENSLIIEVTEDGIQRDRIEKMAREIKEANKQEAVLIQKINNNSWLV